MRINMSVLSAFLAHKLRFIRRLKDLTLAIKKTLNHPKADPAARQRFKNRIIDLKRDAKLVVYIDESGFGKSWLRTHGWSLKGQRCYGDYDWHMKNQTNAIGALYRDKLFAVGLFECSINGNIFETWLEQVLLPKLPAHCILVMDNASFHKRESTRELIESAGHEILWLPAYSPDLNRIEKKWAKVKHNWQLWKINCIDTLFRKCMQPEVF